MVVHKSIEVLCKRAQIESLSERFLFLIEEKAWQDAQIDRCRNDFCSKWLVNGRKSLLGCTNRSLPEELLFVIARQSEEKVQDILPEKFLLLIRRKSSQECTKSIAARTISPPAFCFA